MNLSLFPRSNLHASLAPLFICLAVTLAACGGGGGGNTPSNSSAGSATPASSPGIPAADAPSPASNPAATTTVPQSTVANVQPIVVTSAPGLTRNMLTTSVTVCQPGTGNCATIANIQVDTGSQGLRILASALPASLPLAALPSGSGITAECAVFGGGYTWGTVRSADVRMAGQLAGAIPVQLIADAAAPDTPTDCAGSGKAMQSVATLRANGILGIGLFAADCGSGCANNALPRWYYNCTSSGSCSASSQPISQQVTNPVSQFPLDNNGVVIDLPALADTGAASAPGSMIFGIDTQANNVLGNATVLRTNSQTGFVTTSTSGQTFSQSYIDSGSNGFFFRNTQLPQCGFWYCPSSTQTAVATIAGVNKVSTTVSFEIANSNVLFASPNNAFDNLAGVSSTAFGWGLPFFYGRRVYTAIASRMTSAGPGPYYAF